MVDDEFLGTREDHGRRGQFGDRRATLLNIGRPSIRLGIIRRRGIDHKQKAQGTQTQFRTGITRKENEPVEAAKDRHALKRKKHVNPEEDEERFQQSTMVRGWDENRTFTTLSGSRPFPLFHSLLLATTLPTRRTGISYLGRFEGWFRTGAEGRIWAQNPDEGSDANLMLDSTSLCPWNSWIEPIEEPRCRQGCRNAAHHRSMRL